MYRYAVTRWKVAENCHIGIKVFEKSVAKRAQLLWFEPQLAAELVDILQIVDTDALAHDSTTLLSCPAISRT